MTSKKAVRRITGAVCAVGLLGALLVSPVLGDSCEAAVEWRGQLYVHIGERFLLPLGERVGTGVDPCFASSGCSGEEPRSITLLEVQGSDPAVAVGVAQDSGVYAAVGYFAQQKQHPLHDVLYPARERKRERVRRTRCGRSYLLVGEVEEVSPTAFGVDVGGRDETFVPIVDSQTTFVGLERNGLAYVPEGTRVRVRVLPCETAGGRPRPVAAVIAAAST